MPRLPASQESPLMTVGGRPRNYVAPLAGSLSRSKCYSATRPCRRPSGTLARSKIWCTHPTTGLSCGWLCEPNGRPLRLRGSRHAQRLQRRCHRIGEKHGVYALYDVAGDIEKVPFVFQGDQCLACAVVHCDLQRFGQGPHRLDVPLDAQVAEDDEARLNWQSLEGRVDGDDQGNPGLASDMVGEQ